MSIAQADVAFKLEMTSIIAKLSKKRDTHLQRAARINLKLDTMTEYARHPYMVAIYRVLGNLELATLCMSYFVEKVCGIKRHPLYAGSECIYCYQSDHCKRSDRVTYELEGEAVFHTRVKQVRTNGDGSKEELSWWVYRASPYDWDILKYWYQYVQTLEPPRTYSGSVIILRPGDMELNEFSLWSRDDSDHFTHKPPHKFMSGEYLVLPSRLDDAIQPGFKLALYTDPAIGLLTRAPLDEIDYLESMNERHLYQ
jgi:hypothetical protein